jgi:hypothetical protein
VRLSHSDCKEGKHLDAIKVWSSYSRGRAAVEESWRKHIDSGRAFPAFGSESSLHGRVGVTLEWDRQERTEILKLQAGKTLCVGSNLKAWKIRGTGGSQWQAGNAQEAVSPPLTGPLRTQAPESQAGWRLRSLLLGGVAGTAVQSSSVQ